MKAANQKGGFLEPIMMRVGGGFPTTLYAIKGGGKISFENSIPAAAKAARTRLEDSSAPFTKTPKYRAWAYVLLSGLTFQPAAANAFDICIAKAMASGSFAVYAKVTELAAPSGAAMAANEAGDTARHASLAFICSCSSRAVAVSFFASSARVLAADMSKAARAWYCAKFAAEAFASRVLNHSAHTPVPAATPVAVAATKDHNTALNKNDIDLVDFVVGFFCVLTALSGVAVGVLIWKREKQ